MYINENMTFKPRISIIVLKVNEIGCNSILSKFCRYGYNNEFYSENLWSILKKNVKGTRIPNKRVPICQVYDTNFQ